MKRAGKQFRYQRVTAPTICPNGCEEVGCEAQQEFLKNFAVVYDSLSLVMALVID